MPTVTLPFGSGLDRYTGVMAVEPGSMEDLLNARPLDGKLQLRRGTVLRSTLPAQSGVPCTAVLLLQAVQSQQEAIAVGYYSASREVHVYRITGIGTDPFHIGRWFTLRSGAQDPPVVVAAESYGLVFLAHDEPVVGLRARTARYDGIEGTLTNVLQGSRDDLSSTRFQNINDPDDDHPRFRGVMVWRDYLVGWGWSGVDDDRPEIVRVSLPGQPAMFDPEHYFLAGDRGSPVLACRPAGSNLMVLKHTSTHRIIGESELNFGIVPHYALYGTLASRLALSIQGTCFAWGFEGPWATTGGAPTDLETFLDLERPAPDDLPPASLARLAFAHYIPRDRVIEWHWSDRIYCLHLERSGPRWSYRTRAVGAMSGALLYSAGGAVIDDPTTVAIGSPTINSIDQEGAYSTLTWANGFASGGEVLEVWLRTGSQSWRREEGDARVTLESVQTHNILDLSDIPPGIHEYDVAIRYRLQGRYAPEYRSADPAQWPAKSRSEFTIINDVIP